MSVDVKQMSAKCFQIFTHLNVRPPRQFKITMQCMCMNVYIYVGLEWIRNATKGSKQSARFLVKSHLII